MPLALAPRPLVESSVFYWNIQIKGTTSRLASRSECHEHSVAAEISGTRILAIRVFFKSQRNGQRGELLSQFDGGRRFAGRIFVGARVGPRQRPLFAR